MGLHYGTEITPHTSGSQTVCRSTLVCHERSSGVLQNFLEFSI